MPLTADERIAAAISKLREFILYRKAPDGTSFEEPGDGFFPPVQSPTIRIHCGDILRALKGGAALPPGVDAAELETAVYAVKHNPAGFDRANVGAILAFAWQAYTAASISTEAGRRSDLLALVTRATGLLARRLDPSGGSVPNPSELKDAGDLEVAGAELASLLASGDAGRLPAGMDAEELRKVCGLISTRAYGPGEIDRLCRVLETHVTVLETSPNA